MSNRSLHPLTLTVNSRLARWLLLEHDEQKKQAGEKAWETPQIFSLESWLRNIWIESWPSKYLLNPLQCEKIWEQIISHDSTRLELLHLQGVASQASEAYALIHKYRLPLIPKLYELTDETKIFLNWVGKYERRLSALDALDPCTLMDAVKSSMEAGTIFIPPYIRILGFEEQNPQLKNFIEFLEEKGSQVDFLSAVPTEESIQQMQKMPCVREYENKQGEAEACARWIRSIFKPGKRIGIVVPELEKYISLLKRELSAELVPDSIFKPDEQVFNISLALPLSQEPMIKVAIDLLNIKSATITINKFLSFIQSPFLGFAYPPSQEISDLERKLRKRRILSISLDQFESTYGNIPQIKRLVEVLRSWVSHKDLFTLSPYENNLLPSEWTEKISAVLKAFNWPGYSKDSTSHQFVLSKRYQSFETWKNCLNQLSSLNQILGPINREKALEYFTNIVQNTPFQIKTPEHSIQVVGLLESSGMQFDHLWIMGCHSEALPAHPEPNPFIPYEIRNKFSIPRSNSQRELEFAEQSLKRLIVASPDVHCSFPLHEGDMDLEISPLIKSFPNIDKTNYPSKRIKDHILTLTDLEELTEPEFLPATDTEKRLYSTEGISSGYALLKDQVECPFRAFARYRLNSERHQIPEVDYDNLDRGNVIHKALELFWFDTVDSDTLLELSKDSLEKQLKRYVREALKICSIRTTNQTQFNNLEIERNIRVIHDWLLAIELKRPSFRIHKLEKSISINLAGIKLLLRIDRIDEIPGKGLLLIDYKAGRDAKPTEWFAEKIRSPQLPLYSLDEPPAGLAYGHLVIGKPEFKGTTIPDFPLGQFKNHDFKKITGCSSWEELLKHWKTRLNHVADEFLRGKHSVAPINKGEPCRYCEFDSLCRVQETLETWESD